MFHNVLAILTLLWVVNGMYASLWSGSNSREKRDARKGSCIGPELVKKGTEGKMDDFNIELSCVFYNVKVSNERCHFSYKYKQSGSNWMGIKSGVNRYSKSKESDSSKFTVTCNASLAVTALQPGSISFKLEFELIKHEFSNPIELSKPEVALRDCPTGENYTRENTEATCKCYVKKPGNPSATAVVVWQDRNGKEMSKNDTEAVLVFNSSRNSKPEYNCIGNSTPNFVSQKVSFKPNFAYGPDVFHMSDSTDSNIFDMCTDKGILFKLDCFTEVSSYNPDMVANLEGFGNDATVNLTKCIIKNGFSTFSYNVTAHKGGVYNATCVAFNSVFNDIRSTGRNRMKTITINEPPPDPPSLTIGKNDPVTTEGANVVTVTSNTSIAVSCHVIGGYPPVQSVSIKLYHQNRSQSQSQVWSVENRKPLMLNVTQKMDMYSIECSASHMTNCYNQKSSVKLNVQCNLQARVQKDDIIYEIMEGHDLNIGVDVIGYPQPTGYNLTRSNQPDMVESEPVDNGNYIIRYQEENKYSGRINLTLPTGVAKSDDEFRLEISNGMEEDMVYEFKVTKTKDADVNGNPVDIIYIIGGVVGAVVIIVIILIVIFVVRKKAVGNISVQERQDTNNKKVIEEVTIDNVIYGMGPGSGDVDDKRNQESEVTIDNVIYGMGPGSDDKRNEESEVTIDNVIYGMGPGSDDKRNEESEVTIDNVIYGMGPGSDDKRNEESEVTIDNVIYGMGPGSDDKRNEESEVTIDNVIYGMGPGSGDVDDKRNEQSEVAMSQFNEDPYCEIGDVRK